VADKYTAIRPSISIGNDEADSSILSSGTTSFLIDIIGII